MPSRLATLFAVLLVPVIASADETPAPSAAEAGAFVKGTLIGAESGEPIPDAKVTIWRSGKIVATVTTDGDGNYQAALGPGDYEVTFKADTSALTRFFEARAGKVAKVNGRMSQREGEVIVIREKRKARPARARNFNDRKTPPYSDRAITGNHWRRAWLLLDVSRTGQVTRLKFINRPGVDLDEIAIAEGFKLVFSPSLDEDGKAQTALVVWSFEWPAYWWLVDRMGSTSAVPTDNNPFWGTAGPAAPAGEAPLRSSTGTSQAGPNQAPASATATPTSGFGTGFRTVTGHTPEPTNKMRKLVDSVPCVGSAPIENGSISAVQRDCTKPALEKLFDSEPWIYRRGTHAKERKERKERKK